jgi:murein DD-endopeptidase MepM/ murein hydrolase activator NlpD
MKRTTIWLSLLAALLLVMPSLTMAATRFDYRFPVIRYDAVGMANTHHDYPAADIIADPRCGLPVVSPVDGKVLEADDSNLWTRGYRGGAHRGGKFVSIRGADGVRYYMSHLRNITKGIKPGVVVSAGQRVGTVGKTGHVGSCHLHFGISPVCYRTGDWWIRRGVVWPQPYLRTWKKPRVENRSPRREVAEWLAAHGCPASASRLPPKMDNRV